MDVLFRFAAIFTTDARLEYRAGGRPWEVLCSRQENRYTGVTVAPSRCVKVASQLRRKLVMKETTCWFHDNIRAVVIERIVITPRHTEAPTVTTTT